MRSVVSAAVLAVLVGGVQAAEPASPVRHAYFGDVHIHTSYSFDAFTAAIALPCAQA